jgi:uracil-DNA glycosylase family 4
VPRNPECRDCGLWKTAGTICCWGEGPKDAKVVAIGEAPGEAEARTGNPFTGRSGQLLRGKMQEVGLNGVYITNIVKCRPPKNRTPTPTEIKACRKYLDEELAEIKPKFVMTLGAPASKSVLKKARITEVHGQLIPMKEGYTGIPIYHPAYCLRDPSKLPAFEDDLAKLVRAIEGKLEAPKVEWEEVDGENLDRFIDDFTAADIFAFDLETSGLFAHESGAEIKLLSLGLPDKSWLIPFNIPGSFLLERPKAAKMLMDIIFDLAEGKWATGQNAKFDNIWLLVHHGRRFHLNLDTMLASHTLDENRSHDLESLASSELDAPPYDIPLKLKKGDFELLKIPENRLKYLDYAAKDSAYTLRLARIFAKRLKEKLELRHLFYRLVMRAARALEEIEYRGGMTIDMDRMVQVEHETRMEKNRTEQKLNQLIKKKINWNAPAQVGKVLYGDLELECVLKTDKGADSTSEAAILELKGKHEVVDLLIRYRELAKFLSTYIEGWKERMVGNTLYMNHKIHGTVTGRYSSFIHSVPRDGTIRNLVTAPEGWIFFQADISQAELRVAAMLSRDLEMRECFTKDIDIHWRTVMYLIPILGGDGVQLIIETAKLYCLQHDLSANRSSCEILQAVWNSNPQKEFTEELLSMCDKIGADKAARGWEWGRSGGTEERVLEGRNKSNQALEMEEKLLRALQEYEKLRRSSSRPKSKEQYSLQLSDALSLVSSFTPQQAEKIKKEWKEVRKRLGKSTNFGLVYGMYEKKFIETCRIKYGFEPSLSMATKMRDAYFNLYRSIKPWHDRQKKLAALDGFVRTMSGRRRRLPGIHSSDWSVKSECERQAINSPVQGFIGDYKAMALVEIHETLPPDKIKLVAEHHDALLGIVRKDAIDEMLPKVLKIMRRPKLIDEFKIELIIPMEAEIELGPWGAGKKWELENES